MGDPGVRVLTHILQMNRHLHTIFFDRNLLSLSNFEEIVNAMEEYVFIGDAASLAGDLLTFRDM
jgi:hypothetical protein